MQKSPNIASSISNRLYYRMGVMLYGSRYILEYLDSATQPNGNSVLQTNLQGVTHDGDLQ